MSAVERPAVLFDLDDTILDFHRAEAVALSKTLRELGLEPREDILRRYSAINRRQWELLEEGRQTRFETLTRRFEILFAEYEIPVSGVKACDRYEGHLGEGHWFMPGAEELLEKLHGRYALYLISNGAAAVQASRLKSAGIARYFEGIYISETLGAEKPSPAFVERGLELAPGFERTRALIVGDSLTSDIRLGLNTGIRSCWYNPRRQPGRADIRPDFEIAALSELPPLLERLFG